MVSLCILHVQMFVLQEFSHLRMGGPVANSELEVRLEHVGDLVTYASLVTEL